MDIDPSPVMGGHNATQNPKKRPISFAIQESRKVPKLAPKAVIRPPSYPNALWRYERQSDGESSESENESSSLADSDSLTRVESNSMEDEIPDHSPNSFESILARTYGELSTMESEKASKSKLVFCSASDPYSAYPWKERLDSAYQRASQSQLFTKSPFWSTLLEAKNNRPKDPRFTPKLFQACTDKLQIGVVLNLYAHGFTFDEQKPEPPYPYAKHTSIVSDAVASGILPPLLAHAFPKVHPDNRPKDPVTFYEGGILIEVRDHREGRAIMIDQTGQLSPNTYRLWLRPDHYSLVNYVESQPGLNPRQKFVAEEALVKELHPHLHLDPNIDTTRFLASLHYNIQKNVINWKSRVSKRAKVLVPSRNFHDLPFEYENSIESRLNAQASSSSTNAKLSNGSMAKHDIRPNPALKDEPESSSSLTAQLLVNGDDSLNGGDQSTIASSNDLESQNWSTIVSEIPSKRSKLFEHLQQVNFHPQYFKDPDAGSMTNERRKQHSTDLKARDPTFKDTPVQSHPNIVGGFLFNISQPRGPQSTNAAVTDYAVLEINGSRAPSTAPYEMLHTSLKYGNFKALHFQIGGPAATARLLNQFKKMETPATQAQIRELQNNVRNPQQQSSSSASASGQLPNASNLPQQPGSASISSSNPSQQSGGPSASAAHPGANLPPGASMTGAPPMGVSSHSQVPPSGQPSSQPGQHMNPGLPNAPGHVGHIGMAGGPPSGGPGHAMPLPPGAVPSNIIPPAMNPNVPRNLPRGPSTGNPAGMPGGPPSSGMPGVMPSHLPPNQVARSGPMMSMQSSSMQSGSQHGAAPTAGATPLKISSGAHPGMVKGGMISNVGGQQVGATATAGGHIPGIPAHHPNPPQHITMMKPGTMNGQLPPGAMSTHAKYASPPAPMPGARSVGTPPVGAAHTKHSATPPPVSASPGTARSHVAKMSTSGTSTASSSASTATGAHASSSPLSSTRRAPPKKK